MDTLYSTYTKQVYKVSGIVAKNIFFGDRIDFIEPS